MKVRFINKTNFCLTNGKSYKVLQEYDSRYKIKDDDGDVISGLKNCFEVVEPNNDRGAGRKKIANGVVVRVTVPKELVKELKQLVKDWRDGLQKKEYENE